MPMREDFERSGQQLFRFRSYLPLVLLAVFVLAMRDYHPLGFSERLDQWWEAACLVTGLVGISIRAFTVGHAPAGTSGRNTRRQLAATLNTTGAYSLVRNPLYLGNFFMGLGPAMFANTWWLVLIYVLVFCLYYERIIFAEESFLRERFGNAWLDWATVTPAFVPQITRYSRPSLSFSWRTVLKRESNGVLGLVSVMLMLKLLGNLFYLGEFRIDAGWAWLASICLVLWALLRILKKRTRVLDVAGR